MQETPICDNNELNNPKRSAHPGSGLYNQLSDEFIKKALYGFGIIPLGLLEDEIFKQYQPNFVWLKHYFESRQAVLSKIHLDHQQVLPLVALMGMKEALEQLLTKTPHYEDRHGYTPLFYLAMGGHRELFEWCVAKFYPNFNKERHPTLLSVIAPICADESMLEFLMATYGYTLGSPQEADSQWAALYDMTKYGYQNLFWNQVEVLAELEEDLNEADCLPLLAAKHKHWTLTDKLMATGFELSKEQQLMLVCYAARDDHERFLMLLENHPDTDFSQFTFAGNNVYTLACEGGNQKTVEFILKKGWFNEIEPNFNISRATGTLIAAEFGHIELVQYFYNQFGMAIDQRDPENRDIFCYAAMHGNWYKFLDLVKIFRTKEWVPPLPTEGQSSPLNYAIRAGFVYFAQQFTLKFSAQYFENQPDIVKDAEATGNPALSSWVFKQAMAQNGGDFAKTLGINL